MVPPAGGADLDDVDAELTVHRLELGQLAGRFCLPGHVPQLVAVHVVHVGEAVLAADGAGRVGDDTVVFRGPLQVGVGVAGLGCAHPAGPDLGEQRATLQRVVDDLPAGVHAGKGTAENSTMPGVVTIVAEIWTRPPIVAYSARLSAHPRTAQNLGECGVHSI